MTRFRGARDAIADRSNRAAYLMAASRAHETAAARDREAAHLVGCGGDASELVAQATAATREAARLEGDGCGVIVSPCVACLLPDDEAEADEVLGRRPS